MMAEHVIVTKGIYLASAVCRAQYPAEPKPEIVFIGRSNVGKSSLINSLTRTHNLARVSSQPGKTQTINFYDVGLKIAGEEERRTFYLVDLPGYGYAKIGKSQREIWQRFIREYLLSSSSIRFVCQLIDARRAAMDADIDMFHWLIDHELSVLPVATKVDKVKKTALKKQIAAIKQSLGVPDLDVLPYSSLKNEGRSELLDVIASALIQ